MGGWHWKRPGHSPNKAGGGGLLPEEAVPEPRAALTQRWCKGRNTYLSQLCQECSSPASVGAEPSRGPGAGEGPDQQIQEDPVGPREETEEGKCQHCWGQMYCTAAGAPSVPRQGPGGGGLGAGRRARDKMGPGGFGVTSTDQWLPRHHPGPCGACGNRMRSESDREGSAFLRPCPPHSA